MPSHKAPPALFGARASPSGWEFLLTAVSTTRRRVASLPSSNRRPTLVTGSVYARRRRPSSMFLALNAWPSVAVRSVQLQLKYGTVYQGQCSLLSHWTFFDAAWKLNCSNVLTTDTAPVKRLYCCMTHFHFPAAFLLWLQPWSLSTIMLLWHSFLIILIIIINRGAIHQEDCVTAIISCLYAILCQDTAHTVYTI